MIRLVIGDLWKNWKRNGVELILWGIFYIIVSFLLTAVIFLNQAVTRYGIYASEYTQSQLAEIKEIARSLIWEESSRITAILMIMAILFVWKLAETFPLRLPKVMFVCPAGRREKKQFLVLQFCTKIAMQLLIFSGVWQVFTISDMWIWNLLHWCVILNILLVCNLRIGIGEKKKQEHSYRSLARSREEQFVNSYWTLSVVVASFCFYLYVYYDFPYWQAGVILCFLLLILQVLLLCRNIEKIFERTMDYEYIYAGGEDIP